MCRRSIGRGQWTAPRSELLEEEQIGDLVDVSSESGDADSGRAESPPPSSGKALGKRPVVAEPAKKKRKLIKAGRPVNSDRGVQTAR